MTIVRSPIRSVSRSPERSPIKGVVGNPLDALIRADDNGFAIDFINGMMRVNDSVTPANDYEGTIVGKLSVVGAPGIGANGARLDASNLHRWSRLLWPYNPNGVTIACEVKFDTASDAANRVIFSVDTGGNDRLYFSPLAGSDKPTLSVGTGASAVNVTSSVGVEADTWGRLVAVAGPAGSFIYFNGVLVADNAAVLAANAAPVTYNGIGTTANSDPVAVATTPMLGRMRNLVVLSRAVSKEVAQAGLPFDGMKSLVALGDSHTFNATWNTLGDYYPAVVADRLGSRWSALNFGISGNTTAQMLARIATTMANGIPYVAIVYGGTNDESGTQQNLEDIVAYWQGQGVTRIVVMGQHYLNFASGGDTTSSEPPSLVTLRGLQAAAAAAKSVPYVDLYAWMRQLIIDGTYTQGDDLAWHVAVGNTHLNVTGESILADALLATMQTEGWV